MLVRAIDSDLKPRDIITRASIENAISLVMATGGSTNAVLHYLAIASAAEVPWTIDDFERIRRRVPVLCDLKPSGRYVAVDFNAAGGVPQVLRMLLDAGLLNADCMTITGRTLGTELASVPAQPRADQDVIRPIDKPLYAQGHLAILRGNLAPEGCVAKITGLKNPAITGPARVFDSEPACMEAIMAKKISRRRRHRHSLRGSQRRAGHAGNAGADVGADRTGPRRIGRARHRRPFFGRHMGNGRWTRRARSVCGRHDCARRGR